MIAGRDAATHGEAKNSWLTGTAAWNYYAITQWILGIRTSNDGLVIAPVIPKSWKGFKVCRKFRDVTYQIDVQRSGDGNQVSLEIDGAAIVGNLVPLPPLDTKTVSVKATLR
jgi:cellobiose phosphorylase